MTILLAAHVIRSRLSVAVQSYFFFALFFKLRMHAQNMRLSTCVRFQELSRVENVMFLACAGLACAPQSML